MSAGAEGAIHPMAPAHLPGFLPGPDGSDALLVNTGVALILLVLGFGVAFLWLHTLPERMAHRSQKLQFELVAVLGLLALFTHVHAFWVAGLLLALVDLPDISTPFGRIAGAVERIAGMPERHDPAVEAVSPAAEPPARAQEG